MSTDSRQTKRQKVSSIMSTEEAVTMFDAERTCGEHILKKLCDLVPACHHALLEDSAFIFMPTHTDDLQSLRAAKPHPIEISADDTDGLGAERNKLTWYDIKVHDRSFLRLSCVPGKLYAREGFQELYECMCDYWKSEDQYRVALLGNAGTGKGWFQVYALKQLISCDKDKRDYDIVIRQVMGDFYLIDLDEAMVYRWEVSSSNFEKLTIGMALTLSSVKLKELSKGMARTLFFLDPRGESYRPALEVFLPSLSTFWPAQEYEESLHKKVYLWPWSTGELRAIIQDSDLPIMDEDTFSDHYHKFGGVLRHVVGNQREGDVRLENRLTNNLINIVNSTTLDIDRDIDIDRNNREGYLLCYDNRFVTGKDRFAARNFEYTSAAVVEAVEARITARDR